MHFNHFGKTYQLRIKNADDMRAVLELDESLWVATSAPTGVFRCDPAFIQMLDTNNSGRIHHGEVINAITWLLDVLTDTSKLAEYSDQVSLTAINRKSKSGAAIYQSAEYILSVLKPDNPKTISLGQVREFIANQEKQPLNGDGIVLASATDDEQTIRLIKDVIATVGGTVDASGKTGITIEKLTEFRQEVAEYRAWKKQAQNDAERILPFGDKTDAMYALLSQHSATIDLFFEQCRILRFAPETAPAMSSVFGNSSASPDAQNFHKLLEKAPISHPNANLLLPLSENDINPRYAQWLSKLVKDVIKPILKKESGTLSLEEWKRVKATLQPYADYLAARKGGRAAHLSNRQLDLYLKEETYATAEKLIELDKAVYEQLKNIREVERLCLYHKKLLRFLNNFVNFSELYTPPIKAMFEEGSLQIDGRWFDFVLRVNDINQHSAIAKSSNIFTLYLEVSHTPSAEKYTIAVPATAGTKGNLGVGKRGIFIDVKGVEHDAVVIKIIDNPISLREALLAPFARVRDFIIGKIESISGNLEKKLQKQADSVFQDSGTPAKATQTPGNSPAGMLMGISLSAAAVGSAFAFITKTLAGLTLAQKLTGVLGAAALVIVPVSLIAILKLRRQDLSSLLEGCGWSINARMRFDRIQRNSFTRRVPYPLTATGTPHLNIIKWLIIAALLAALIAGFRYVRKTEHATNATAPQSTQPHSSPVQPPPGQGM